MRKLKLRDIIVLVVFLVIAIAAVKVATAQVSGPKPRRGEWLCWATKLGAESPCGAYGWHVRKPVALKAAMGLCNTACGGGCAEDYCEALK